MPAGLSRQHGDLAGGFGDGEVIPTGLGELAGAVGGYPAELLFVQFDQHAGGQQAALGE
ncbi:hypothetical protein [Streptomyces sp. NPDC002671]